jgi:hypothetical protein
MAAQTTKASFEEWTRVTGALVKRLQSAAAIYKQNRLDGKASDIEVFLVKMRQSSGQPVGTSEQVTPYVVLHANELDANKFDELRITALAGLFKEVLGQLPDVSNDMQQLLQSGWTGECNGRIASDLFKGPLGTHNEGIGSGFVTDGQLPWVIDNLLDREATGSDRPQRTKVAGSEELQQRADMARRWAQTSTLRSRNTSGAIE